MHTLFGGSNYQFYATEDQRPGIIKFNKVKFSSSTTAPRVSTLHWQDEEEEKDDPQESKFTHKSNAQELIAQIPVIEVDGDTARCTGVSELGYGHPVEYISLNTRDPSVPNVCKYCGLRFVKRGYLHSDEDE
ncbi:unnamed protein product [Moneuplotes crassus]|uniref:Zinc finger CHCC-type domain-containing protein n=1 Tax=Euplotes crassus TaxID=5936 RepID=A0AAD1Y2G5_EUPCR|nr:unnamed protein product [Moneuplotes crassus]